jgi:predicted small lipoprotein YifL
LTLRVYSSAALLLLALGLADCGKKGPPQPPPGVPNVYPRAYPRE